MNLLYKGRYKMRFEQVCNLIKGKTVEELCFGDTIIADFCNQNNIKWRGIDINKNFVNSAIKNGFSAELTDLNILEKFPSADVYIITGSLYHFHSTIEKLFTKILASTTTLIISEPIHNLSGKKGIIGYLARLSASVNGSKHDFRFTETTLLETMKTLAEKIGFTFKVVGRFDKDFILVISK